MSRLVLGLLVAALLTLSAAGGSLAASAPHRIVSLSPTATESLFAIGAGAQVVAVDDQSDYPRQAPRTRLSYVSPNVEAIAGYRPDLVIVEYDPNGVVPALRRLGIRVVFQRAARTFADVYSQIVQLGSATGHGGQAAALVKRMKSRISGLVAKGAPRARGLSVYHELEPDLYSATSSTFIGQIYKLFGLRNIADAADTGGTGYPKLSPEYVVSQSPDIVVLADIRCCGQTLKTVAARPGWSSIAAVRSGTVVRIDDSIASRWGPRVVDFVRAVAAALVHVRR